MLPVVIALPGASILFGPKAVYFMFDTMACFALSINSVMLDFILKCSLGRTGLVSFSSGIVFLSEM